MYYDLKVIPKLEEFIHSTNKKELANSLNLKYIYWNHKNKCNYHILKYDKQWLNKENNKSVGLLRSVIFDDEGNLVCFSPPKSLDVSSLVIDKNENVQAEKFVEGTMINVFYNKKTESWEMATKSSVGGESCFFMQDGFKIEDTFKYMFDEVCNSIDFDINSLKKDYCYSFVMQHPKNRIVKIISTMKLYLVEVYEIQGLKVNIVPFSNLDINKKIIIPDKISINNSNDFNHCKETLASMNTNYQVVGVVLKNKHGERFKIRNPNYEHVKKLRGNQPKLPYQYLILKLECTTYGDMEDNISHNSTPKLYTSCSGSNLLDTVNICELLRGNELFGGYSGPGLLLPLRRGLQQARERESHPARTEYNRPSEGRPLSAAQTGLLRHSAG